MVPFRRDGEIDQERECNVLVMTSSLVNTQMFSLVFKYFYKVTD